MNLKLEIHKDYLNYRLIFDIFLIIILVSGYVEHIKIWRTLSFVLFLGVILFNLNKTINIFIKNKVFLSSFLICGALLVICVASTTASYASSTLTNLKSLFYPFCLSLAYVILTGYDVSKLRSYLNDRFAFLNIAYIVNLYVLSRQITGSGFMIKSEWSANNSYYEDLCAGLFGFNSTHVLSLFSIFMLLYNFQYSVTQLKNHFLKIVLVVYTAITEVVMIYCSMFNDNMALFVITPLFLLIYYLNSDKNRKFDFAKLRRFFVIAIVGAGVLWAISKLPGMDTFIDDVIFRFNKTLFVYSAKIKGSNERLAIVTDALSHGWGWTIGYGINTSPWRSLKTFGYEHFGISSIGSLVYLTGIWFYLALCVFYSSMSANVKIIIDKDKPDIIHAVTLFASFVTLTIYTYVVTDIRMILLYFFIMASVQCRREYIPQKDKKGTE